MSLVKPEDDEENKLIPTFQMTLGKVHLMMLKLCTSRELTEKDYKRSNSNIFQINGVKVVFPKIALSSDMNVLKSIFRKANTQFKRSMQVFVLDGFVTEHVNMLFY